MASLTSPALAGALFTTSMTWGAILAAAEQRPLPGSLITSNLPEVLLTKDPETKGRCNWDLTGSGEVRSVGPFNSTQNNFKGLSYSYLSVSYCHCFVNDYFPYPTQIHVDY